MAQSAGLAVREAIRDLYQRRPSDFVAARQALARSLRDAGRRDDAATVQRLRKPTVAAWATDRLAGRYGDRVEEYLAAAADVRTAQARAVRGAGSADALRDASRRRRELTDELVELATAELRRLGAGSAEAQRSAISSTLEAAALDQELGEQLRVGLVVREATPAGGFEGVGLSLVEPPAQPARRARSRERADREAQERARREAQHQRRRDLEEAAAAAQEADELASSAEREAERLHEMWATARDEARAARTAANAARRRVQHLRRG